MAESQRDPSETDDALLARVAAGDFGALAQLHARHGRAVFAYLCCQTPDWGLAEELLQDTLLAVWTGADGFAGDASVRSWLFGIARRRAHDVRRRRFLHLVPVEDLDRLPAAPSATEELALVRAELGELATAIGSLPVPDREILGLTFVHGLSYQESAEVLAIPVGTVKSRLNHARRALRAAVGRDGEAP